MPAYNNVECIYMICILILGTVLYRWVICLGSHDNCFPISTCIYMICILILGTVLYRWV